MALNADAYGSLWADLFPQSDPPPVDFAADIVVSFNPLVEAMCPDLILLDVVIKAPEQLLFGAFQDPLSGCSDIAGSQTFVVAVHRADLPQGQVTFRNMMDYQLCSDCGRETEEVKVDL